MRGWREGQFDAREVGLAHHLEHGEVDADEFEREGNGMEGNGMEARLRREQSAEHTSGGRQRAERGEQSAEHTSVGRVIREQSAEHTSGGRVIGAEKD